MEPPLTAPLLTHEGWLKVDGMEFWAQNLKTDLKTNQSCESQDNL